MGFVRDLRQRRIIQIFIGYLAGGWIALEVIDQLVNNEIISLLVYRLALVAFLTGVPAALVIGWYHGEKGHQKAQKFELFLLAALGLVAIAGGWRVIDRARTEELFASASELNTNSLAIMYLDTDDEQLRPVADGLTDALIAQFERVPSLNVTSRNGAAQLRGSDLEPDSIARILNVGTIIEGSVERRGDDLRATLALYDGGSGMRFKEERFDWPLEDVINAQDQLAGQVSELLREWLGEEVELRASRRETESVSAWLLVQQTARRLRVAEESFARGETAAGRAELAAADSLAGEAAVADSAWSAPRLQQARIDYRFARTYDNEPLTAERYHRDALTHVDDALRIDGRNAEAYEVRGRINYVRWLLGLETDPARAEALLTSAEQDLRQATTLNPRLASAYSLLAHLANQKDDIQGANLAARQAYEADAFLEDADIVLWRLFHTSYDLENFTQARSWCLEGRDRFPDDPVFKECQLWLMTAGALGEQVDIDRAWELLEEIVGGQHDHGGSEYDELNARILVAGAIARAGLPDSAVAVLQASRGNPQIDPRRELLLREAFVYATILEDHPTAISLLREYLTANPERLEGFREHGHWWWRDLRGEEAFRQLVGS